MKSENHGIVPILDFFFYAFYVRLSGEKIFFSK